MKMKYYRFLYSVTKSCFIHFGEVKDTQMDEKFAFLYLRGTEEPVDQTDSEHMLFLCPKYVDLVVLGRVDVQSEAVLKGLLARTKIRTLVIPAQGEIPVPEQITGVEQIVRLNSAESMGKTSNTDAENMSKTSNTDAENMNKTDSLDAAMYQNDACARSAECFEVKAAGWKFSVKCWTKGALAMFHMLDTVTGQINPFDDCVMNVKEMDSEKRCSREEHPDGYGCALGCVLHQDHDVCKYRNPEKESPYLTGTMLVSGEGSINEQEALINGLEHGENFRFFAFENSGKSRWERMLPEAEEGKAEPKRYYIGEKVSDEAVAKVCRSGLNRIPAVLREGRGICCSGLLKYAQED